MPINTKTATAAIALMIGAGAYPFAAMAQTGTETEEVEVEVIESEEAAQQTEQGVEETGQAVEQTAEQTGQAIGQAAEETGQALEEGAQEAGELLQEGAEGTVEVVEEGAQETGEAAEAVEADLDEAQRQELEQAAAEGRPVPRPEMIMGVQKEGQWLSSELIDQPVMNPQGEEIGDIGAILFSDTGPDGVVVEVGGFLGMGEKDVAIRWDELQLNEQGFILDATEEQLENAPEFVSLEEKRAQAELQAEQEAAEAEQQAAQQAETMEPAEGEAEVEVVE